MSPNQEVWIFAGVTFGSVGATFLFFSIAAKIAHRQLLKTIKAEGVMFEEKQNRK